MKYLLVGMILFFAGCSTEPPVQNTYDRDRAAQSQAVQDFIAHNYAGWAFEGISGDYDECPCELHLSKNGVVRVVRVRIETFTRPDGTTYWLAFEMRVPIDDSPRDSADEPDRVPSVY